LAVDFTRVVSQFRLTGEYLDTSVYNRGHINDTFVARTRTGAGVRRYVLQRINHHVFRQPEQLMANIEAVTVHLRAKILAAGGDPARETLSLVPTHDNLTFYRSPEGDYWRIYDFIEGAQTYETIESSEHVYNASKAIGNFQRLLSDFPITRLYETIPDFHNTRRRFETFAATVEQDPLKRAASVREEIDFVLQREGVVSVLVDMRAKGELPERITHNDTKFNNIMIDDQTGQGVCIVDLDTVMPGLSLYDFGDAIRSAANPAAEDEPDLSRVVFDIGVYEQFTHGYLDAVRHSLTPAEIDLLPFSAILMTLECGMRFLADHLAGDTYFRIHRPHQNRDRARTQFKLVRDMEAEMERMKAIVEKYR
jgi:Ser/Thr protein kinase RdoA (MazF antagonist)